MKLRERIEEIAWNYLHTVTFAHDNEPNESHRQVICKQKIPELITDILKAIEEEGYIKPTEDKGLEELIGTFVLENQSARQAGKNTKYAKELAKQISAGYIKKEILIEQQRINNAILADKCDELDKFEKDCTKKSDTRVLPCKHLAYKTLNNNITELFINGEEWVKKSKIEVDEGKMAKEIRIPITQACASIFEYSLSEHGITQLVLKNTIKQCVNKCSHAIAQHRKGKR